jgi:hypothetical protein
MPDLHELLREDGASWRSEIDAHRPPPTAVGDSSARRRPARLTRWRAPLAAAVAAALVAVGVSYLAIRVGESGTHEPALPVLSTSGTTIDPLKPAPAAQEADARGRARAVHLTNAERGAFNFSMPWRFLALLDHGRNILVSYTLGDPCDRPLGFRVQQGSNAVELTALSNVHHGGCEQSLLGAFGTIHLDRPLGKRLLLHAPTDRH